MKDRQGNKYTLVSIIPSTNGSVEKIVVENSDTGARSQRLANGRVRSTGVTPRDILLTAATRQRRAITNPFFEGLDEEDEDDEVFITKPRSGRARFGSFVTPDLDFDSDDDFDIDDIVRGPNSNSKTIKHGDIEITIKVKGSK